MQFGWLPGIAKKSPGPVTQADYEALSSFRHAVSRFLQFSGNAARKIGLSPQQHQALLAIKGFSGRNSITVKELAGRLQLRHNSAVGLVDRMASKKLVRRIPDKGDRRVVHVALAAPGRTKIARLAAAHREELRRIGPELREHLTKVIELAGGP